MLLSILNYIYSFQNEKYFDYKRRSKFSSYQKIFFKELHFIFELINICFANLYEKTIFERRVKYDKPFSFLVILVEIAIAFIESIFFFLKTFDIKIISKNALGNIISLEKAHCTTLKYVQCYFYKL